MICTVLERNHTECPSGVSATRGRCTEVYRTGRLNLPLPTDPRFSRHPVPSNRSLARTRLYARRTPAVFPPNPLHRPSPSSGIVFPRSPAGCPSSSRECPWELRNTTQTQFRLPPALATYRVLPRGNSMLLKTRMRIMTSTDHTVVMMNSRVYSSSDTKFQSRRAKTGSSRISLNPVRVLWSLSSICRSIVITVAQSRQGFDVEHSPY